MRPETRAAIGAALFTLYAACFVVVLALPRRRRDPHDGMAVGCLGIVALGCAGAAAAAFAAPRLGWTWLGARLFEAALLPFVLGVGACVTELVRRLRRGSPAG